MMFDANGFQTPAPARAIVRSLPYNKKTRVLKKFAADTIIPEQLPQPFQQTMDASSVCSDDPYSSLQEDSYMDDDSDEDASSCLLEDELEPVAQGLNLGALLLTQERYSESIEATQQVILLMKNLERRYEQQVCSGGEDKEVLRVAPVYRPVKVPGKQRGGKETLFLYPFLVESRPTTLRALQAVAFYNLAVAFHITQQETSEESRLETSACYEYSLSLMDTAHPRLMDPEESFLYVYLAACHNLSDNLMLGATLATSSAAEARSLRMAEEWGEILQSAFLAVPPYPHCPVYQHFERATNPMDVAVTTTTTTTTTTTSRKK